VFAALAVSRLIERSTGWSIARFVKTLRRYHTVTSQAGDQTITAADPLPEERYELSPSCALPPKHTLTGTSQGKMSILKYPFCLAILSLVPVNEFEYFCLVDSRERAGGQAGEHCGVDSGAWPGGVRPSVGQLRWRQGAALRVGAF
jgi:hypothetical protein